MTTKYNQWFWIHSGQRNFSFCYKRISVANPLKFKYIVSDNDIILTLTSWFFTNCTAAAAAAKSLQSCPTLCDPIDGSPLGSPVPGILQARTLEWVATAFSNAWKWKGKVKSLSCVRLPATSWTAAYQAPPSMGFSRQEYWSGVPLLYKDSKTKTGNYKNSGV